MRFAYYTCYALRGKTLDYSVGHCVVRAFNKKQAELMAIEYFQKWEVKYTNLKIYIL